MRRTGVPGAGAGAPRRSGSARGRRQAGAGAPASSAAARETAAAGPATVVVPAVEAPRTAGLRRILRSRRAGPIVPAPSCRPRRRAVPAAAAPVPAVVPALGAALTPSPPSFRTVPRRRSGPRREAGAEPEAVHCVERGPQGGHVKLNFVPRSGQTPTQWR
ncbi:hypothetical protein SCWH03_36810 [Streptomyces pacificus]|uniref:Uncharacterized protein n=1 Tax=Streptomyces pacificus TaxID=2705029 RepID=A0A6A0AYG2_9ACTN|nr:hypothetical protein SCWH03_36810 [Streptomyces pacificus]